MPTVLSLCWRYVRAFVIIYLCLYAGNAIAVLLPITIPGSILGMLTLFALLATQILPVDWVKPGCHLLIRYMALLFVPISVGIMNYTDVLSAQFGPIVVSIVVSTFLVLTIVGWSAHKIHTRSVQEKPGE
ncbi:MULTISPECIES: CidA/LrgA family protein [Pantoea]|jgi:holin-like protein|uniref:CidA/LrgA family protein n=1 Tax=Pantoea TaxID=53335 RepID=UPI000EA003D0|nr:MULTISPECIES: CidA/LrgA family protein [Pantoea]MDU6434656.1 CidA/LrgA family protein [Pantoea sp.]MBZ6385019.1 CidA/LrgA family protein [Pantoea piersonii]MBZ6401296.1 CidA/LrgA family protein [Pantoea piersonii]MBZ6409190.1 CidA/LrgA family protein [Pantoea piersonii]MBZ6426184.1 CidA/LrgA family protein [Pantoea piersonii]